MYKQPQLQAPYSTAKYNFSGPHNSVNKKKSADRLIPNKVAIHKARSL